MKRYRWIAGPLLAGALLMWPETALNAARQAMANWATAVAPALFPFMLLMPLLTCPDAARAYERLLGRVMRPLLKLPGAAAPAIVIAITAGSPAGAQAITRVGSSAGLTKGQAERLILCLCGLGPTFLVSGVGASMLGSARLGWVLLRTQLVVQIVMLFMLRPLDGGTRIPAGTDVNTENDNPMTGALVAILSVAGYMAFFGALTRVVRSVVDEAAGSALLCAMEVSSGARAISAMDLDTPVKLIALSALTGFGGLCVGMQNYSFLKEMGVKLWVFLAARLEAGLLSAAITFIQFSWLPIPVQTFEINPFRAAALLACVAALPALLAFGKYNIWYEGNHAYTRSV